MNTGKNVFGPLCPALLLGLSACFSGSRDYSSPTPISVSGNSIQVQPGSKFMEQLRVVSVGNAPGGEHKLRTVGQMIAVANPSGALAGDKISWVTLDSELIRSLGLRLSEGASVGFAYGVTSISSHYRDQIHPGERVDVYRYGLRQDSVIGAVVSVQKSSDSEDAASIVFSVIRGQNWYPGTNCQIEFPLIHRQAVALSPLSMLHEGLREYVLKEISPGRYEPMEISVVNETSDQVFALGNLVPGDRAVESGAILLKPLVHQILAVNKEARHVR